jgi:chromosome segregation protein
MYLKRLELYGFKTFADRTELEFGPGITAIVGPNGSGKSNISDGILWVLGEQGMKSLRSAKSTDVIFNGSDVRKALGMAEVHLTLDNSAGLLPTDFSEVTITRRVFRSGESEYLINRVPVRLRDVQELFMDTGIGKQSYSIISQGEVDAVLSTRSEERRALFEEVAGIHKYKQRKKEALRKLEQTRQNLFRVSDIIAELDGQLGPMAEQAEKARQYQVYHTELIDLQLSLLVAQYQGLQGSLARARERETELIRELDGLRHGLNTIGVQETTQRAELQALEDDLEERRGVESRLAHAVSTAENALNLLRQQAATAQKEVTRLQGERSEWEGHAASYAEEIATAQAEEARLTATLTAAQAEVAQMEGALQEAAAAVSAQMQRVTECRRVYMATLDRAAKVRNELARVESLLKTAATRAERLAGEQVQLAEQVTARRAAQATAKSLVLERGQARERLIAQRAEATRARQGLQETQAKARRDDHDVREALAGARARQKTLQELEESLEGYFPGVRAVAAAVGAGTLTGWYAPVADLLGVPAELEVALEVALGANLQDVVCDTEGSARAAVDFLKRTRSGRATFIPLDLVSPAPRAQVPTAPGIRGLAMDLVGYDAPYEVVAQHLLGRVVIADDLDAALALARSGNAKGWSHIVTLEGEVVRPARTITGGSLGKGTGLLKRKRELGELTEQVAGLERKATASAKALQSLAADLQRLEAELTHLAKAGEEAAVAVAEAERQVATVGRDIAALEQRTATLAEETTWLERELTEARASERTLNAQLDTLTSEGDAAEVAIAAAERALAGEHTERDALTAQHATLRLQATELTGRIHAQQVAVRRAANLRDTLATRLADNARAQDTLARQLDGMGTKEAEAAGELVRMRDAFARSSGDLDAAKGRRTAALEAIAQNLETQKRQRDAIEECQGRLHRANLRTTQVETEIGFLEGQFFEDYRLTPDQALARATPVEQRGLAIGRLKELQSHLDALGPVNVGAIEEHVRIQERLTFLTGQRRDLEQARESLTKVILEIDGTCKTKFLEAFQTIAREFQDLFMRLFGGGTTELALENPDDVLESGIEIHVTVPGKRNQNLVQLSGGERALTALALLFAMLRVKPSPFVVLDEIDAPLDEANVGRYCDVLRDFTADTQFLTITHNKGTMEVADVLYGVTMEKAGVSKIVSVRLTDHQMA